LAVIAVLLIVLGAAVAGLLALRIDERVPVLVARDTIGVGQQITAKDLSIARMASEGVTVIPADDASKVIGRYASQEIPQGRLIDGGMLNTAGLLTSGQAAVGIALQAGRYPANGLRPGDVVQVVRSVDGNGKVIAERGIVGTVDKPSEGAFGAGSNSATVVTVVVPERLAAAVAAAGMADQVSLILIERGTPAGGG
jgi:flagella basal body P-ring formation protein FlgA